MPSVRQLVRLSSKMHFDRIFKTADDLHKKTGKSRLWLVCDILNCGVKYSAGYMDYSLFEFYNLTKAQRKTYVTRGINNEIVRRLNDSSYWHCFENKDEFNTLFDEYVSRGWLKMSTATPEEFEKFIADRGDIISKPLDATCGVGVEKLNLKNFKSPKDMYDHLKSHSSGIIEDYVVQHPALSNIYPTAVNTLRIVTIVKDDGVPGVVYAFIRIGNGGKVVDNINSGGMAALIDVDTGTIIRPGADKDGKVFDRHPMTGTPILGFVIPYWKESVEMCLNAAKVVEQVRYVAWDVAVTPTGPVLIEGNHFPGHDILQLPAHVPDKMGMLPRFRQFVNI